jgi:hypothetical protein
MKKLLAILALALMVGFVGQASAAPTLSVAIFDVQPPAAFVGGVIDPTIATSVTIQVNMATWDLGTDLLFGIATQLNLPTGQNLVTGDCTTAVYNAGAGLPFSPGTCSCGVAVANEKFDITVSNPDCAGNTVPLYMYRITFVPTGNTGTLAVNVDTDVGVDWYLSYLPAGCPAQDPTTVILADATLDIVFAKPPCTLVQTGCPTANVKSDAVNPITVNLAYAETGDCSPESYSFDITCDGGACPAQVSVDGNGDVVILPYFQPNPQLTVCVSVEDTANVDACSETGSDCECCFELEPLAICNTEIYLGGYPVPPLNTFNLPGRRGLALTCGDTVQFDFCSDCDAGNPGQNDPVVVWSIVVISGTPPAGTAIDANGLLTIGPDCTGLTAPAVIEVVMTDTANGITDSVIITIGEVIIAVDDIFAASGAEGVVATVTLENKNHAVKGIQTEIKDDSNYLTCTSCSPDPDRAPEFICTAIEQADGDCKIVMISTNPAGLIEEGTGAVATIAYDVNAGAPANGCFNVGPTNSILADRFGDQLCVCEESGEVCFIICGDIYPRECLPDLPNCGDGKVDIFDILEEIDFVLGYAIPSDCQLPRADVPTGTPPYCTAPDGEIDILDVLVIIDMALGKANCCDYYYFGKIY